MYEFRYILGLILIVIVPLVIVFWTVIHLGSSFWRQRPAWQAYSTAFAFLAVSTILLWLNRDTLMGRDLGLNWLLFVPGAALYLASIAMARPIRKHLSLATFAGVPEITNQPIPLLESGPFSVVRHPRYLMVIVGIIGWVMMVNWSGVYVVALLGVIGLVGIIMLEERDLRARFGAAYSDYSTRVPMLLPRLGSLSNFFD
ncbi:isoprenylcysteine carboxylmethyltransferase family protein [Ahrensia sp. R2A130]|uniref:methyltransferase family protein n=1 Tax=Ahrensia sp. R2A130 TaxID=744979 RepID=UPI0001E0841A|nr:isoprenylcysteine carboxylmethyltransferase family protein [Ahrensia sp. R2A130]EFL89080.1 isoprenylcysteine carboxyl methyltransferase [Ahrensia sp. R2A130]